LFLLCQKKERFPFQKERHIVFGLCSIIMDMANLSAIESRQALCMKAIAFIMRTTAYLLLPTA
ncbi:MAG: hypothetical protein II180_07470, partial [Proteobacteria bacterium]|nr:hypothetical protein [Pseudomonadota bacterium]